MSTGCTECSQDGEKSKVGLDSTSRCPKMWDSILADGSIQSFYFTDDHLTMPGWFKRMKVVLEECRLFQLWDNSKPLNGECKDFKCTEGAIDCCCHHILFNQPDFTCVKSHLEEVIMVCGHLCDFYPKFHCELNYIEQYWGAVKLLYRSRPWLKKMDGMEKQVAACLNDIPLLQIWRYRFWNYMIKLLTHGFWSIRFANCSVCFMDAYRKDLNSPQAVWANRKYHGHWVLPNNIMETLEAVGKA